MSARVSTGKDAEGKETFVSGALPDSEATDEVVAQLKQATWTVVSVERKQRKRNPTAPYITSKLQQDASGRLGFNVRRTMGVAQRLYEGVEVGKDGTVGLITYMRTDSTRVSADAITAARGYVTKALGAKYLPEKAIDYKGKNDAQDAHEAIRPTNVEYTPDSIKQYLSDEQYRLYDLIWRKFVSSQMSAAVFDQTTDRDCGESGPDLRLQDFGFDPGVRWVPGGMEDGVGGRNSAGRECRRIGWAWCRSTRSSGLPSRRRGTTRRAW